MDTLYYQGPYRAILKSMRMDVTAQKFDQKLSESFTKKTIA